MHGVLVGTLFCYCGIALIFFAFVSYIFFFLTFGCIFIKVEQLFKSLFFPRNPELEDVKDISLDAIFGEDDIDEVGDDSESDGYLSEVLKFVMPAFFS